MGAGWVAGVTRARAMVSRRLGIFGARQVASASTLGEALRYLGTTPYRRFVNTEATLAEAQRAVAATLLWHLRVLAGWQPRAGANTVRALAAGFEIANVEDHLRFMEGQSTTGADQWEPYRLGGLATAWPRLAGTRTPSDVRAVLSASAWGDPGGESAAAVAVGMRMAAAARVGQAAPTAARWAAGRAALLAAREVFVAGRRLTEASARHAARLLGAEATSPTSFADFRRDLPPRARWVLDRIDDPADLWRAETHWWIQLEQDGKRLLHRSAYDASPVLGAVAVLSSDAWRVRAGLEVAARGGRPLEAFDALV